MHHMAVEAELHFQLEQLLAGNRRSLAKAITLVESKKPEDQAAAQQFLEAALPYSGNSIRIGISGSPGVGKSTFIEAFGLHLISQGKKVAVLAVDPSSPVAGGSILGDKTRMSELSRHDDAFIRPSPAGITLGGVAQKTRETKLFCEAAGYDVVLVETVGVGQSEYQVAQMVDFFLVLMLPSAGDELQGIKKGIMELADALVINKADGDSLQQAKRTQGHYQSAIHLFSGNSKWTPPVLTCSALEGHGISEVWQTIIRYETQSLGGGLKESKRAQQNLSWMNHLVHEMFEAKLAGNLQLSSVKKKLELQVRQGTVSAFAAAKEIIDNM